MKKVKILVIEDEEGIRDGLKHILSDIYEVELAENGVDGLKKAIRRPPDIILLDLKMPEMDGFQVCKAFREDREFDNVPIIILSAFNSSADRTKTFELGADDYITKPFEKAELIARIQRKLHGVENKISSPTSSGVIVHGDLELDLKKHEVHFEKKLIALSAIEFKLLHLLVINFDQLVSRDTIVDWVWEKQAVSPRLIDPHILSLRNKLHDINITIQSVYGKGYILKSL